MDARRRRVALAASLAAVVALAWTAHAPAADAQPYQREGAVEIGLQMGGLFFLEEDAVPFDPSAAYPESLASTFAYTLTGAYNFTSLLGVELGLQLSPAEVNRLSIFSLHLDLLIHPMSHEWFVPFVGVGPSFSVLIPQDGAFASDPDPALNAMIGVKLFPWDMVGFRIDLRYLLRFATAGDAADGRSEVIGHDLLFSIGLMVNFGGERDEEPILLDTDGDGILDEADACPTVPGVPSAEGCPDADGDSIADADDRCPEDAGPAELDGCPDTDGDSIADVDDRCPEDAGPAELEGCPDTDGDSIADVDDRCPKIPGVEEHQGCPPPPPDDVAERFSGSIAGITFELDSAVIRESSHEVLDEAVEVLREYPQLNLEIEGHTSSEGTREYNLDLSRRRAEAVKAYLVERGVDPERLTTVGYGPDRPTASNDTRAGREENRRIEFRILRK